MIINWVQDLISRAVPWYNDKNENLASTVTTIVACGSFLLLWRLWTFSIRPTTRSNEPEPLPYWIPFVGHAIQLHRDAFAFFNHAFKYFGNNDPFVITILGRKFCVVQSLNQIATVYKNSIILTSDDMIKGVYAQLGMSPDGNHKIWNSSEAKTSSLAGQPIVLSHGSLNTQLLPGQNLDDISAKVFEHMEDLLQWKNVSNSTSTQSQTKTVLLHRWCADVLGEAVAKACFGEELLEASPDFLEQMYTLDLYTWQILLKIPTVFVRKVTVAKQHCVEAFARYFRLPAAERPGMCYWVRIVEEQQRQAGMNDYDIGIAAFVFYWAIYTSPAKVVFWLLSLIVNTPGALQEIRIEILNCVKRDGKLDLDRVSEECPLLNAAWYEVIRFANTDAMRMVEEPVIIGSKLIQKGTKIYLPYRQLHRNKAIFGEDVDSLNIKRFLNNDMSRNLSYKPFGGGTSICPGRYIARKESLAFIALVLHMYDLEFDGPTSGVPKLDTRKPALGLSDPVDADKILAIIKPRA